MRFVDLSKSLPQQASNEEFFLQLKHFLVRNFIEKIQLIKKQLTSGSCCLSEFFFWHGEEISQRVISKTLFSY